MRCFLFLFCCCCCKRLPWGLLWFFHLPTIKDRISSLMPVLLLYYGITRRCHALIFWPPWRISTNACAAVLPFFTIVSVLVPFLRILHLVLEGRVCSHRCLGLHWNLGSEEGSHLKFSKP